MRLETEVCWSLLRRVANMAAWPGLLRGHQAKAHWGCLGIRSICAKSLAVSPVTSFSVISKGVFLCKPFIHSAEPLPSLPTSCYVLSRSLTFLLLSWRSTGQHRSMSSWQQRWPCLQTARVLPCPRNGIPNQTQGGPVQELHRDTAGCSALYIAVGWLTTKCFLKETP